MAFQSTINSQLGAGIAGEASHDAPSRANPVILASANAANNQIGNCAVFYIPATGANSPYRVAADKATGTGAFAGFLGDPKAHASYGTAAGGPLAPTITLPNGINASAWAEGMVYMNIANSAAIGDEIYALESNGTLVASPPGAAIANATKLPATVQRWPVTNGAGGLACLHVMAP